MRCPFCGYDGPAMENVVLGFGVLPDVYESCPDCWALKVGYHRAARDDKVIDGFYAGCVEPFDPQPVVEKVFMGWRIDRRLYLFATAEFHLARDERYGQRGGRVYQRLDGVWCWDFGGRHELPVPAPRGGPPLPADRDARRVRPQDRGLLPGR
jgi:hypothetical protein